MEKLGENSKSTKDELVETQQQIDELEELGETNPLLDPL